MDFHMRASEEWMASLAAASDALNLGKTEIVERALAVAFPEYFAKQGPGEAPGSWCAKYAPRKFTEQSGENFADRQGGQPVPKAKRKGDDSRGPSEKNTER